jgi:hypothetical protein
MTIEDIILSSDKRGISQLRGHMPPDFCTDAAELILSCRSKALSTAAIITGFYIARAEASETDGPPGAIALADALGTLGFTTVYITDKYTVPLLVPEIAGDSRVIEFPMTGDAESRKFAVKLRRQLKPQLMVAIERPGMSAEGKYYNMRGIDISDYCARIDYFIEGQKDSIGIGDGGNELGMGNLADVITQVPTLAKNPAALKVATPVIASVSNWGAYGIIAALSVLTGNHLLPAPEHEEKVLSTLVARGAVDGISGERTLSVDGFGLQENLEILRRLQLYVDDRIGGVGRS